MKFLSKKEVRALTTLSYAHIDRLEKAGKFPERISVGMTGFRVVWVEAEVLEWMEARVAKFRQT